MTHTNGRHDIEEIVARELDEYQQSLFGKLTPASDPSVLELPIEVQERIRRAKLCVATIHSMRNSFGGLSNSRASHPNQHLPKAVGRFEIRDQLGIGGFGIVYRAYDPFTKRDVALKIPRIDAMASEDLRKRFELEATAAGKLDHPNIIPVLEAGTAGPIPYIASAYYDGPDLAKWMHRHQGSTSIRAAVELVLQLALAVENAHQHGVLHRDIKPSNVLLAQVDATLPADDLNSYIPKLMDFGLAKIAELAGDVTRTGAILGTCKYMAPEQAEGKHNEITTATDVYALGGLLFELLTGRPPFEGDAPASVLFKVINDDVPDVRTLRKDTPLDLSVIVAKCLSKSKADRYSSAQELADELSRFWDGTPIKARPVIWWERLWKWARRRPALASATFLAALFPATILVLSLLANRILLEKNQEIFQKNQEIVRRLYSADMRSAKQAVDDHRVEEAAAILRRYEPSPEAPDVTTLAYDIVAAGLKEEVITEWKYHDADIFSIAISPDKKLLATASRDGTACLWKYGTGELIHRLIGHQRDVNVVLFSPDGKRVATCGDDGTVRLWDVMSGKEAISINASNDPISCILFRNNGKQLVSGGGEGVVTLWNAETGQKIKTICSSEGPIYAITSSVDELSLIIASKNKIMFKVDPDTGMSKWQIHSEGVELPRFTSIATHPQGELVVAGGYDGNLWYIDAATGNVRGSTHQNGSTVSAVAILPNELEAVTADQSGRLVRRVILADEIAIPIRSARSRTWSIIASESDDTILTSNANGYVRIENIATDRTGGIRSLAVLDGPVEEFYRARQKKSLYAIGGHTLAEVDLKSGRLLRSKRNFQNNVWALTVDEDRSLIATGEQSGRVCLWHDHSLELKQECPTVASSEAEEVVGVESVQFVPNRSSVVYVTDSDRLLRVWDYEQKAIVWETILDAGTVHQIAFMPDRRMIVTCRHAMYTFRPIEDRWELLQRETAYRVAVGVQSISNDSIILCQSNGTLHHIASDGAERYRAKLGRSSLTSVDVSPSREWVVVGGRNGEIFLLHTSKLIMYNTTVVRDAGVLTVCFAGDESAIYAGLDDGRIVVIHPFRSLAAEYIEPANAVTSIAASPSSSLIAIQDPGHAIVLLESSSMNPVKSWLEREFELASFSPDGSELIVTKGGLLYKSPVGDLNTEPTLIKTLESPPKDIIHISNEKLLAKCQDQSLRIITLHGRTKDILLWDNPDVVVERLAVSSDRNSIAAATSDKKLRIWTLRDGQNLVVDAHDAVRSIAFRPDGNTLAVGGEHGAIDMLSLQTRKWKEPIIHSGNVEIRSLKFADRGKTLLAASSAGGIHLWDTETNEMIYSMDVDLTVADIHVTSSEEMIIVAGKAKFERGELRVHRLAARFEP